MIEMEKLGKQLQAALAAEVPPALAAFVTTTQHSGRLQTLFNDASLRLLRTHQEVLAKPHSTRAKFDRQRSKALLDLIRARMALAGCRKPTVKQMMGLINAKPLRSVVDLRRAA